MIINSCDCACYLWKSGMYDYSYPFLDMVKFCYILTYEYECDNAPLSQQQLQLSMRTTLLCKAW